MFGLLPRRVHAVAGALLLAGVVACASDREGYYRDPGLSPDQVATLSTAKAESFWALGGRIVTVKSVDRLPLYFTDIGAGAEVALTQGSHEISAEYSGKEGYEASFPVVVKAGRRYQIRAGEEDKLVRIWVEDSESKAVVGMVTLVEPGAGS